jgi:hypothetical protein
MDSAGDPWQKSADGQIGPSIPRVFRRSPTKSFMEAVMKADRYGVLGIELFEVDSQGSKMFFKASELADSAFT